MRSAIDRRVRRFIAESFLYRDGLDGISDTESLLDAGLIDSTGVLELVGFLETEFGIQVADADIIPENLDSIRAIADYVAGKTMDRSAA